MISDNSVSNLEFNFPIPVLGLISPQNTAIKLTEQFSPYRTVARCDSELILMYYSHLLTGHLPDVAIHHAAEVPQTHKLVHVRGDAFINQT